MTDVLVTGSAGGIGRAVVARFRDDGRTVVGLDRVETPQADESVVVDLGDLATLETVASELAARRTITTLVHVAAHQPLNGAGGTGIHEFERTLRVNLLAVDVLVGALRADLESVVLVGSVHAVATTVGINAYATSKAALEGWARSAAIDLGPAIRVNTVRPGAVDTAKLHEGFARWGQDMAPERRALLEARTPLRRIGRPEDVAAAVRFLAGPEASFITGAFLTVDGGASALLGTE